MIPISQCFTKLYSCNTCSVLFSVPVCSSYLLCGDSADQAALIRWALYYQEKVSSWSQWKEKRETGKLCRVLFFFNQLSPELMCVTFTQIYISQNYYISPVNYMGLNKCRLIYPEKKKKNKNKKLDISE